MIEPAQSSVTTAGSPVGLLTREFTIRLLNFSPAGCLVETSRRIDVGTVGSLLFTIDGTDYLDDVQVVRCQQIEGAGALYQVGIRFLWTSAAGKGTLRGLLERSNVPTTGSGFRAGF